MNRYWWMAAAALISSAPAMAQTAPAIAPAAADPAPLDPARLAAAQPVVDKLLPVGTYRRMMSGSFETMMRQMMGQMGELPVAQVAALGGLEPKKAEALGNTSINQIMAIYDPYWEQRRDAVMHAIFGSMGGMMDAMEPAAREALAKAYARAYTVDQLAEMNRFFSTPTGSAYAANSMAMFMSPEMMTAMQKMAPEIMKHLPEMMEAAKKANAALPPARKLKDLTADDKARLAKLLGVNPAELRDPPGHGQ